MKIQDTKEHWNTVYQTKTPEQRSWTQAIPQTSLDFIDSLNIHKNAKIIDVGGGDSMLAGYLLDKGFENITVLDISEKAIDKAKERLGSKAQKINWIICDITGFEPSIQYDVWHDRATFHFLTTREQVKKYVAVAKKAVKSFMIIGTFSTSGPLRCSGLEIKQYSEQTLKGEFENDFEKIHCATQNHITPFNTAQHFLFCSFRKKN